MPTNLACFTHSSRVCTVGDIALQGQFECPGNNTNITNTTCIQANIVLQQQFINTTYYTMDNGWTEEPHCQIGIPGITVSHTIVGKLVHS